MMESAAQSAPDWYSSLPDAVIANPQIPAEKSLDKSASAPDWYASLPDAPAQDTTSKNSEDQAPIDGTMVTRGMVDKIKNSVWGDIGSSFGAAIPQAIENTANLPQNLINIPLRHLGISEAPTLRQMLAGPNHMRDEPATWTGEIYQPKTLPGKAINTVTQALVGNRVAGMPTTAATAAAGGLGAQAGASAAEWLNHPEWADVGGLAGGIAGGGISGAIKSGIENVRNVGANTKSNLGLGAKEEIAPGVRATPDQQSIIGQEIIGAAKDPQYVKNMMGLNPNAETPGVPFVPGSKPTLAESLIDPRAENNMGDPGIAAWQKGVQIQPGNLESMNQRRADNAKAQNNAISSIAHDGDPTAVGKFFSAQLNHLESTAEAQSRADTGSVQQATEQLGGHGNPAQYGANARQFLTDTAKASKEHYDGLWNSLKPYDAAAIDGSIVQDAVGSSIKSLDYKAGENITAPERNIYQAVNSWETSLSPPTFGTLRALNKTINDAIQSLGKSEGFSSAPVVRLMGVKAALGNTIEHNVSLAAQGEAHAVRAGTLSPENTIAANLARLRDEYLGQRQGTTGGYSGQDIGRSSDARSKNAGGYRGTAGEAGGGFGDVAGNQGLSDSNPRRLTPEAAQTYKDYKSARTKHGDMFESGPVGQVLARGERAGTFNTPDSLVTQKFFHGGKTAHEDIVKYAEAVGDNPSAVRNLQDGAIAELRDPRNGAINPDGTINGTKYQAWVNRNNKAINALPELKEKLSTAAKAQEALNDTMGRNKAALEEFNNTKAAEFIKSDPIDAIGSAFRGKSAPQEISKLVDQVKSDPAAREGLRRATAEYILREVRKAKDGDTTGLDLGSPKKFRDFMDKHSKSLVKILGGQGKNTLDMVVADIRRSAINEQATKLAGRSDTAQLTLAADKASGRNSLMSKLELILEKPESLGTILATAGTHIAGIPGGVVGGYAGAKLAPMLHAMRQAHITTLDRLRLEAALNPELARILMSKIHSQEIPMTLQKRAAKLMIAVPMVTAVSGASQGQEKTK